MKSLFVAILAALLLLSGIKSDTKPPVVDEAILHLNKPYRYAKAGPASFDCSGFVCYCYNKVENIQLPHSAKEQGYNEEFQKIENIENLLPGDLVFFNTNELDNDECDHSGIYIGDGEFVHCSSGKGKVIISSLIKGYYNERFSWGRRIKEVENYEYND